MIRVSRPSLERLLADHYGLRRQSADRWALSRCPVCGDAPTSGGKRWRHVVDWRSGKYHCYRGGCTRDLLELVCETLGTSPRGAMEELTRYGEGFDLTPGEGERPEPTALDRLRERLSSPRIPTEAPVDEYWPDGFSTDWIAPFGLRALRYALRRRVPDWFIESGRLGYVPPSGRFWLRGRLVFLLMDDAGRVRYAVGRAILEGWRGPKYLFPRPEEAGRKSDHVFNLDVWGRRPSRLVVTEGVLSALSVDGGVAVLGHRVSEEQAVAIAKAQADETVLAFDPDVSAREVYASARRLRDCGVRGVRVARLTAGDPNDAPAEAEEAIRSAAPLSETSEARARLAEWR